MKRNMSDQVHEAYKDNLYSSEGGGNHLLKCKAGDEGPDCEDRLAEIYFDKTRYGQSGTSNTLADISSFLPSATGFANTLVDQIKNDNTDFDSREDGFTKFETSLLNACRSLTNLNEGRVTTTHPTISGGFRGLMLDTDSLSEEFKSNYVDLDTKSFLPYFAWKHIDEMYPENERREYYLIERMHTLTKYVFILYILHMNVLGATLDEAIKQYLEKVMTSLVKESLVLTNIGNPDVFSLDDTTAENVKLSSKVRTRSELLLKNKRVVQSAQDNLRSLVDIDKHVQRTRTVAWYAMMLLLVLLALSVAGMSFSYARGRNGEVYLVAGVLVLGVLAFEAFKGAERLFSLPSSVVQ